MSYDLVTGLIPRAIFKAIAQLPHGGATNAIRKYYPLYGLIEGEPTKWRVRVSRVIEEHGFATVEASSEKEAEEIGNLLAENDVDWNGGGDTREQYVIDAVPA